MRSALVQPDAINEEHIFQNTQNLTVPYYSTVSSYIGIDVYYRTKKRSIKKFLEPAFAPRAQSNHSVCLALCGCSSFRHSPGARLPAFLLQSAICSAPIAERSGECTHYALHTHPIIRRAAAVVDQPGRGGQPNSSLSTNQ